MSKREGTVGTGNHYTRGSGRFAKAVIKLDCWELEVQTDELGSFMGLGDGLGVLLVDRSFWKGEGP